MFRKTPRHAEFSRVNTSAHLSAASASHRRAARVARASYGCAALAVVAYIIGSQVTPPERWPAQVLESRSLPYIYNGAVWAARQIPQEYQPQVPPPPPVGKQAALNAILTTSPTGRASDPPIRR